MTTIRSSRCVFTTGTALHRVFVAPIERSNTSLLRTSTTFPSFTTPKLLQPYPRRSYVSTQKPAAKKFRLPRDDEIQSWSVSLVTEDGKLEEPRSTSDILSSIDRKKYSLVVVAAGQPGVPPICKIIDKKAMRETARAKTKHARTSQITTKTIELNWAIDGNDLRHRLERLKEFLGKGWRVEVLLAPKRKGRKASEEEGRELLEQIKRVVREVEGAKESKPMDGKLLGTAKIFVEGRKRTARDRDDLEVREEEVNDAVREGGKAAA